MNAFLMLIRRELWEHKTSFVKAPIYTALIISALALLTTALGIGRHGSITFDSNQKLLQVNGLSVETFLYTVSLPLMALMILTTFIYLLNSLYEDRQDRSILFWKSLPTTDSAAVLAKLITAVSLIPFFSFVGMIILQLAVLVITSILTWHAKSVSIAALYNPIYFIDTWAFIWLAMVKQALWLLPVFAWCLLVSAYVKKHPLLYAILIPVLLAIIEKIIIGKSIVYAVVTDRFSGLLDILSIPDVTHYVKLEALQKQDPYLTQNIDHLRVLLTHSAFWYGLVFAVVCLALAVLLRKYRFE